MKNVNIVLVRFFQFSVLLLFIFLVLSYFASFLLLPLAVWLILGNLLAVVAGLQAVVGLLAAAPVIAGLGFLVYRMPLVYQIVVDTGYELTKLAIVQYRGFECLAQSMKGVNAEADIAALRAQPSRQLVFGLFRSIRERLFPQSSP